LLSVQAFDLLDPKVSSKIHSGQIEIYTNSCDAAQQKA